VVRSGSLQGRRGRLPSKTKSLCSEHEPPSPPVPLMTALTRAYLDTLSSVPAADTAWKLESPSVPELLAELFDVSATWSARLPMFTTEMGAPQQTALLTSNFSALATLRVAYKSMESAMHDALIFESHVRGNVEVHIANVRLGARLRVEFTVGAMFANDADLCKFMQIDPLWQRWAHCTMQLAKHFKNRLEIDSCAFSCLLILALLQARGAA